MAEIEYIEIDPVSRLILSPADMLLGVMEDANVERKYFKCPKIVGDNVDLSQHQIYIKYIQATDKTGTKFKEEEPGFWHCEDVSDEGDYITFSWLLTGNVFVEKGFIAFSVVASDGEEVRWNTYPAVGTVLLTIPGGLEEVAERYPDIITQLLNRMDAVEALATPEAMQNYVDAYLAEHPAELDEDLNDNTKAAPAGMVGELKGDFVEYSGFEQIPVIESGYIANNSGTVDINTIVSSSTWCHAIIQCAYGDVFTFNGESGGTPRLWAFIKNDGTIIANEFDKISVKDKVIHAPKDTAYLILNKQVADASICYKGQKDDCSEYDNMPYDDVKLKEGYYLNDDGILAANENFLYSDFIPVQPGDTVLCTGYFGKANTNTTSIFGYSGSSEEFKATPIYSIDGLCYVDRAKVTIPCINNIKFVRVCGRKYNSSIPDVRIYRAEKSSSKPERRDLNNIKFNHAENYCIEYPTECGQIGLMSVLDIRKIPVHNKINGANLYMWAAPHDGLSLSAWGDTENTSNAGSVYLWYSDKPDGEWKLYSDTPVLSRAEFARMVTNNPSNAQYIPSDNGGIIHILHLSSPDVVWDEALELTRDGKKYKGGFRIFFHATGWTTASSPDTSPAVVQRTYYATSVDGLRVDTWNAKTLDSPTIWIYGEDDIDALSSDYARFFRQGNAWYSIYNAEPLGGTYNIAIAKSINNGATFRYKQYLLKANAYNKMVRAGIPGVLIYDDCIYIAYTAVDSSIDTESSGTYGDGIYLARITEDGTVYDCGQILKEKQDASDDEWDSYRICAPFLLEYDGHIYMYYGGASKKDATSYATRWEHSHIGVSKEA